MDDDVLRKLAYETLYPFYEVIAGGAPDSRIERLDGVFACVVPAVPERSFMNAVLYEDPAALDAALPRLADLYGDAGVAAWTVWVRGGDTAVQGSLAAAGNVLDAKPAVIRGNASEIISLSGGTASARGVDSTAATDAALDAAQILALRTRATVAVTGATDYITDGRRTIALSNGSPLMTRVTGVGCALSASVAAFVGAAGGPAEHWLATVAAIAYSTVAGELAARDAALPGSFAVAYLDRLASLDAATFAATLVARDIAAA